MGMFLAVSGVIGAGKKAVEAGLKSYAEERGGSFRARSGMADDPDILVLHGAGKRWTILYPEDFLEWEELSSHLSAELDTAVFSFQIHDEVLWMYVLYDHGEEVDRFNPLPEYLDDEITDDERETWVGDAEAIASRVPGLDPSQVAPYLKAWNLDEENPGKAFPDDDYEFQDPWQVCDFLHKLELDYPLDDAGAARGATFEFKVADM